MQKLQNLNLSQKFAIAIPVLFLLSCLTKHYVGRFRYSPDLRWIYQYGSIGTLFLCALLVIFSLGNSIWIASELKTKWQLKISWLLLSSSVFLYISIGLLIITLK